MKVYQEVSIKSSRLVTEAYRAKAKHWRPVNHKLALEFAFSNQQSAFRKTIDGMISS